MLRRGGVESGLRCGGVESGPRCSLDTQVGVFMSASNTGSRAVSSLWVVEFNKQSLACESFRASGQKIYHTSCCRPSEELTPTKRQSLLGHHTSLDTTLLARQRCETVMPSRTFRLSKYLVVCTGSCRRTCFMHAYTLPKPPCLTALSHACDYCHRIQRSSNVRGVLHQEMLCYRDGRGRIVGAR